MLSRCFFDFSVGVWAFVIGLSQISSFLSLVYPPIYLCFPSRKYTLMLLYFPLGIVTLLGSSFDVILCGLDLSSLNQGAISHGKSLR